MADSESAILHFIIFNLKSRLDKSPGSHLQIFSTYQERQTGLEPATFGLGSQRSAN